MSAYVNNNLDVILVKPRFNDIAVIPPIGLAYIAAILEGKGIKVGIIDNTLLNLPVGELVKLIVDSKAKLIGVSASTPMVDNALEICEGLKTSHSDMHICMGGPHPSAAYQEVISSGFVDSVVIGEGEESFPLLADAVLGGGGLDKIEGIAYRDSMGNVIKTSRRKGFVDLNTLPLPAYHLLPLEKYYKANRPYGLTQRRARNLPVMATRGCPSTCTFCQRFMGAIFRAVNPEKFVDELLFLSSRYKIKEFNFLDDNFTYDKDYAISVCSRINTADSSVSLRFPNGVREDFLDDELLAAIKECGGYHLDFGIESGVQRVLDLMKKRKKIENIREKVILAKKNGFAVSASFLFGTPGETLEEMYKTIEFAKKLPLDGASFGFVVPFPGTALRRMVIEQGNLLPKSYSAYNCRVPLIQSPDWSEKDLLLVLKKAYMSLYLRPEPILRSISHILRNPRKLKSYTSKLFRLIKYQTPLSSNSRKHYVAVEKGHI